MGKRKQDDKKPSNKGKKGGKKGTSPLKGLLYLSLSLLAIAFALVAVTGTVYISKISKDLPTLEDMADQHPSLATEVYDRHNRLIAQLFMENRTWVSLDAISPAMIQATLAAEDGTFYDHGGLNFTAIMRALWVDLAHKAARQGGSTITQQLARNLFLSHEKSIERKAKEAILALRLEKLYSKDEILEMYLNMIYFGHGTWGINAASQNYFGKKPAQLSVKEAAVIAGLIAAPEKYSPYRSLERAKTRQAYVIRRMVEMGWLTPPEADEALDNFPTLIRKKSQSTRQINKAPYFVSYILFQHLLPTYGKDMVYRGGLKIYTTLDLDLQEKARESINKLKSEGALVALDPTTGQIITMIGGKDFEKTKFNRAFQAYRQPGSAFKPFVYATAIQQGLRPIDHVLDAPLVFENGWEPGNYGEEFHGEITLLNALSHSYNVSTVRLAQHVGVGNIIAVARAMGITSPHLPHDLSLSLGSASVTPLELAGAYCSIANGGMRVEPYSIREIRSRTGEILEQSGPKLGKALKPEVALTVRGMLQEVMKSGTGRYRKIKGYESFGKTGTTNEWSDAWFIGGIPGLVSVVYAGNDDHTPLGDKATGSRIAGPIWSDFMTAAASILKPRRIFSFPADADVETVAVCRDTGFLATSGCPSLDVVLERGKAPFEPCPYHGGTSWGTAEADPNAPQLILVDGDELLLQEYALLARGSSTSGRKDTGGFGTLVIPSLKSPGTAATSPVPENPEQSIYEKDPSPVKDMETRYQDLLKQYGLTD